MKAFLFLLFATPALASAGLDDIIAKELPRLEKIYQDLHRNPELSFKEFKTAAKLAGELRALGFEVREKIGGTGIAGILRNGDGPVTLVRTDMDALPMLEKTGLPYASLDPAVTHSCGHDFHMTAFLGTARTMVKLKDQWRGTLVFIGQPAEEIGQGAKAMMADPEFDKLPKATTAFALHTNGAIPKGKIAIVKGPALANVNSVDVVFKGKGAHGSSPNKGIDPIVMAAEYVLKLQTIISRERDPQKPGVITVGSFHAGTKHNIIPDDAKVQITVRSYDDESRQLFIRRIEEMAKGIAKLNNAPEPEVTFKDPVDVTFNDIKLAEHMTDVFKRTLGENKLASFQPIMGGEDFGSFGTQMKIPTLFFWVGEQMEKDPNITSHSPLFAPDFRATAPLAISAMTAALLDVNGTTPGKLN